MADPAAIERQIAMTVGTVESGLFVARTSVVVATSTGVEVLIPPARR
jgi:ribose 5-phosphate isomerase